MPDIAAQIETALAVMRLFDQIKALLPEGVAAIRHYSNAVSGGENPRIDGDVAGYGTSALCGEGAVVLAPVKDARRRFAVAFGHP